MLADNVWETGTVDDDVRVFAGVLVDDSEGELVREPVHVDVI